jgi:hypothetical protein
MPDELSGDIKGQNKNVKEVYFFCNSWVNDTGGERSECECHFGNTG